MGGKQVRLFILKRTLEDKQKETTLEDKPKKTTFTVNTKLS